MQTFYPRVQPLAEKYFWLLLAALLVFSLWYNQLGIVPPQHYYRLSVNPYTTRTDIASDNYWQESVLLPVFANLTGLNSHLGYHLFCVAIILGSYVLFAFFASRELGRFTALLLTILLVGHSTNAVLFSWIGTPDGVTLLLGVLALFLTSRGAILIITVLAALNHPMASLGILGILVLRALSTEDKIDWKSVGVGVLGTLVGLALVRLFLAYFQIDLYSRIDYILSRDLQFWINQNRAQFWLALFSFHGLFWIVLLVCLVLNLKRDPRYYVAFVMLNLIFYAITFFTVDTTRVFSLLAWGAAFQCVIHSLRLELKYNAGVPRLELLLVVVGLASLVFPRYVVWGGSYYSPPYSTFYTEVLRPALRRLRRISPFQ